MNVVIIDDEIRAIETLSYYLKDFFTDFKVLRTFLNINDGLEFILKNNIDVLFLDINMPKGNGIELLKQLTFHDVKIIMVTAHSKYAIEAIKYGAFDYILKPIELAELNRIHQKLFQNSTFNNKKTKINISISSTHYVFHTDEIIYVSSEGNYSTIHSTTHKELLISRNLKKLELEYFTKLPFFRIHQSFIVNINHIKGFTTNRIILNSNTEIPISSSKQKSFFEVMEN
jgi:two-component system LytT family response regulator